MTASLFPIKSIKLVDEKMMKILLVCDKNDWILGKIAKQLKNSLEGYFDIVVISSLDKNFVSQLKSLQQTSDIVHFLSPWIYYRYKGYIYLPCVVNLWHMVDWKMFDPHIARIDTLCVGSNQWQTWSDDHLCNNTPIIRMPYGLDTREFRKYPDARRDFLHKLHLPEETLIFGFAGSALSNQSDRKGLDRLFECFTRLKQTLDTPVLLRMIGMGWHSEIIPPELVSIVLLENYIPEQDLSKYYSSLDYYLCLSRIEGVPYPVLEAMSCQSVVISTLVGVVPEIMLDGVNGFILSDNYKDELICIVKKTADNLDYRRQCGELARKTILNKFSLENAIDVNVFHQIYKSAIDFFYRRSKVDRIAIQTKAMIKNRVYGMS